jgi:hypothetical protein
MKTPKNPRAKKATKSTKAPKAAKAAKVSAATGSHLTAKAKQALTLDAPEKIDYINQRLGKWISYPKAEEALARMKTLFNTPQRSRMPCLLIVAATNNGKTMIADQFIKQNAPDDRPTEDAVFVPVLKIQAPPKSNANWLLNSILLKTFTPFNRTASLHELMHQVVEVLPRLGLKLLIIDEIQHVMAGNRDQKKTMLNTIKYLANELKISMVALGVKEGLNAFQADPQLTNRFEPFALPSWSTKGGQESPLIELLDSFEASIPLAERSYLGDEPLTTRIISMGESTIGGIAQVVVKAATEAIIQKKERISMEILDSMEWVAPSEARKISMEALGSLS